MLDIGNCEKVHDKRGWSDHNTTSTTRYRENAKIQRNIHSSDNVYFEGLFALLPISRLVHWQVIFKLPLIKHSVQFSLSPVPVLVIRIAWWMIDSRETKAISSQMAPAPDNHQPRAALPANVWPEPRQSGAAVCLERPGERREEAILNWRCSPGILNKH